MWCTAPRPARSTENARDPATPAGMPRQAAAGIGAEIDEVIARPRAA